MTKGIRGEYGNRSMAFISNSLFPASPADETHLVVGYVYLAGNSPFRSDRFEE